MPKVSIIIPACGQSHLTRRCLETLYQHTSKELFEVIVINNNSPDDTLEILKAFPEVKVITNDINKSFASSINQGADASSGEYILSLNNDTYFFQSWLESMLRPLEDKKVAVVGAKCLFPDGKIQHAGIACYRNRQPFHAFWGEMPSEKTNLKAEYPAVTFACALVRRPVFEELSGLSLDFPDGNYEDVDFCLRAREKGYKIIYNPEAVLYHEEAGTKKVDLGRAKATIIRNLRIYKEKWQQKPDSLFAVDQRLFPRILVGCPTYERYEFCLQEYSSIVRNLMYPNYDILVVDNSETDAYAEKIRQAGLSVEKVPYKKRARDRIVDSRNLLRQKALDGSYDYLFSLEQDVIPPPGILLRLLKHDKKAISGLYFNHVYLNTGQLATKPVLFVFHKKEGKWGTCRLLTEKETWSDELISIAYAGLGCMLIHQDVLKEVAFRFDEKQAHTDDKFFCFDARKKDIELWADTGAKCRHLLEGKFDWDELVEKGEF